MDVRPYKFMGLVCYLSANPLVAPQIAVILGITMLEILTKIFNPHEYVPHGHCYLWQPGLVWLHVVSNIAIALAYFSIPVLLVYFVSKRKDIPFNWVFLLFGAFIIACGMGHLMDIWTIWHPAYWLAGAIKALTAIISIYTALELIPLIPKVLALPSPAQLETANRELEQTICQLQQTQSQLIQTEKLSSLGQLIAGLAHEINNPINFIHGNLTHIHDYAHSLLNLAQVYQKNYPEPESTIQEALETSDMEFIQDDLPKVIASMQLGADRIRQIVLSLRNFSRIDEAEMKAVNIHDGIDSTLLILQHRLRPKTDHHGIQIIKTYGDLPLVECYAGQLNQVFMNILSNAIDAIEHQHLQVSDTSLKSFIGTITIQTEMLEQDQVLIQMTDDGPGISPDALQKIFAPFFTTKPASKGTGLGLSISHQIIVEKHGGQLECYSSLGMGTTFQIKIPIRQQTAVNSSQPALQFAQ
jgi:signal transduction histidine kinase